MTINNNLCVLPITTITIDCYIIICCRTPLLSFVRIHRMFIVWYIQKELYYHGLTSITVLPFQIWKNLSPEENKLIVKSFFDTLLLCLGSFNYQLVSTQQVYMHFFVTLGCLYTITNRRCTPSSTATMEKLVSSIDNSLRYFDIWQPTMRFLNASSHHLMKGNPYPCTQYFVWAILMFGFFLPITLANLIEERQRHNFLLYSRRIIPPLNRSMAESIGYSLISVAFMAVIWWQVVQFAAQML